MNSTTSTVIDPAFIEGLGVVLTVFGCIVAVLLALAAIFLPFFVWGIYSRICRLEKLHRQIADDILAEFRRRP